MHSPSNLLFHIVHYRLIVDLMLMIVDYREYSKSSSAHISEMLEVNDAVVIGIRVSVSSLAA